MAVSIRLAPERYTTRRMALAALAGVVTCVAGLLWRQNRLGGLPLLDSRGWYTPEAAAALFEALDRLDANARAVYAATGLTIDMVFPAATATRSFSRVYPSMRTRSRPMSAAALKRGQNWLSSPISRFS